MKLNFYLRGLGIGMIVTALLMGIGNRNTTLTDAQIKERAAALGMVDESEAVLADNKSLENKDEETKTAPAMILSQDKAPAISIEDDIKETMDKMVSSDEAVPAEVSGNAAATDDANVTVEEKQPAEEKLPVAASIEDDGQAPLKNKEQESAGTSSSTKDTSSSTSAKDTSSSSSTKDTSTSSSAKDTSSSSSAKDTSTSTSAKDTSSSTSAKDTSSSSSVKEDIPSVVSVDGYITITVTGGQSSTAVAKACENAGLVADAAEFDRFLCQGGYDRRITTGRKNIPAGASMVEIAGILTVK